MQPYLLPSLELTPVILGRVLEMVPGGRLDLRTDPDRFTLREAIAHLADWEEILLGRVHAGVERPGAEVMGVDEGQRAIDQGYASWEPRESLRLFRERRLETVRYFKSLTPEQWEAWVVHSERGRMSTYDQANMLLGHDLYHLEHATQFLEGASVGVW